MLALFVRLSHSSLITRNATGGEDETMQHIRNIETEQSKRDLRWNSARTLSACNQYMAIEAQRCGALGFVFVNSLSNSFRGPRWLIGAQAGVADHYAYAREIMGVTDADQLYA
jgi:hypothetical protein